MMLVTLLVLCLTALVLTLPLQSTLLIQALMLLAVVMVGLNLALLLRPPGGVENRSDS
ncbi:hypothetical protein KUV89_13640 [Marinobacter hydrocarbonoclasticus]|nr:hypothetical protein [Marinobacter nauticus]